MAPDIGLIRAVSRENLSRALRLKRGKKILVIDSKLTPILDLIANFKFLQFSEYTISHSYIAYVCPYKVELL